MWLLHWVLPLVLHCSFTGCDRTSSFCGCGKKTAWDTWPVYPEITEAFHEMLHMPQELSELSLSQLERFVVLIYDRTSACLDVNEARKQLFTQRSRLLENIPPTQAALRQHIRRAMHQANIMEPCLGPKPTVTKSFRLGIDWYRCRLAATLDNTPWGITGLL